MIKTKHTHYDYLIVGAGLFGAVFAQEAKNGVNDVSLWNAELIEVVISIAKK